MNVTSRASLNSPPGGAQQCRVDHQRKTVAAFNRVVDQAGILGRERCAPGHVRVTG
jgi:hypothetical protein